MKRRQLKPMRALSIAPTCVAAEPDQETDSPHRSETGKSAALLPRIVSAFEFVSQMKS
ncbi:hypothetical protein [Sinorhizobium sp. 22678]|uniref:hypothetical protein n=1 Tax=Sinorhizobium sp. 22678 TaxID=3453955 RepID=UPI003F85F41A